MEFVCFRSSYPALHSLLHNHRYQNYSFDDTMAIYSNDEYLKQSSTFLGMHLFPIQTYQCTCNLLLKICPKLCISTTRFWLFNNLPYLSHPPLHMLHVQVLPFYRQIIKQIYIFYSIALSLVMRFDIFCFRRSDCCYLDRHHTNCNLSCWFNCSCWYK